MFNPDEQERKDKQEPRPPRDDFDGDATELRLQDGRVVIVDARLYPTLSEWDWYRDPETQRIASAGDVNGKRYLIHEELRFHQRLGREVQFMPILDRRAIRAMFGHRPEYREMLLLSQEQREFVQFEHQWLVPAAPRVLAECLSSALVAYFQWREADVRFTFEADATGLIPGVLTAVRGAEPRYRTLGEWMEGEYTGGWAKDAASATGLRPELVLDRMQREFRQAWWRVMKDENFGTVKPRRVIRVLKDADKPVWLLLQHATECLADYPLP